MAAAGNPNPSADVKRGGTGSTSMLRPIVPTPVPTPQDNKTIVPSEQRY